MTSFRDVKRMGITLVGVLLLFVAIFAASYAVVHQEHKHHAQAVLMLSERAAMAKIAMQSSMGGISGGVSSGGSNSSLTLTLPRGAPNA